jgi:hypothetical protein
MSNSGATKVLWTNFRIVSSERSVQLTEDQSAWSKIGYGEVRLIWARSDRRRAELRSEDRERLRVALTAAQSICFDALQTDREPALPDVQTIVT